MTLINKSYIIEGRVVDENTINPISGVIVSMITKGNQYKKVFVKTNQDGYYTINVLLETDVDNDIINERPSLIFEFNDKYSIQKIIPFDERGSLIKNPPTIKLKTLEQTLDGYKSEFKQIGSDSLSKATNMLSKSPEEVLIDFIKIQIKSILSKMIPALLTMIAAFGIDRLQDFLEGEKSYFCPKKSKLNDIIKLRNEIVTRLNSLLQTIDSLVKTIGIIQGFITILELTANVIMMIPIPVAVAGIGIPQSIIQIGANTVQYVKKLATRFSSVSITILMALFLFKSIITLVISLLNILDKLIIDCGKAEKIQIDLVDLDPNLLIIQKEINGDSQETNIIDIGVKKYNIRRLNGFILEVIIIEKSSIGTLKSKQAVAKNSQGIILIKGEPSFSSNEQILIDELEFYIKNNNLKAY